MKIADIKSKRNLSFENKEEGCKVEGEMVRKDIMLNRKM